MKSWIVLSLIAVILVSGCTSTPTPVGVMLNVRADPSPLLMGTPTTLFIDLDNQDVKTIDNVFVSVFDTGLLRGNNCEKSFEKMLPFEFQSFKCLFNAPGQDELREPAQTEINTLATFDTTFSTVQLLELITQSEYQRRIDTGDYRPAAKSYSYRDRNVQVNVEFSEAPPFVLAPGKRQYVYFTITNVGNGFVREIEENDFRVLSSDLLYCPPRGTLEPQGKEFPKIACEVIVPQGFLKDNPAANAQLIIDFAYNYELRNSIKLDLIK